MRELLSRKRAMEVLGIGHTKLWELTRDGEIPFVRVGRKMMFRPEHLERWLESRQSVPW